MILFSEVNDWRDLEKYAADVIIISAKDFALYSALSLSFEELKEKVIKVKQVNKQVALRVDALIEEERLPSLRDFLNKTIKLNIDYYLFSDISVLSLLKKLNYQGNYIYSATTINCSTNDALYYKSIGVDVILSSELCLNDYIEISHLDNIGLNVYGHNLVFYSARKLLSSYQEKYNVVLDNKYYVLEEKNTKERFYFIEEKYCSLMYNEDRYYIYKDLDKLRNIKYLIINSQFINNEDLLKINQIYHNALTKLSDDDLKLLLSLYPHMSSGFLNKKVEILNR